ncbi:hypothetical protein [Megasphaera massiliensis]|uniref:hypothetical protein n=1 Tax=Megasphaera massiliensis TaxID=1232428 RepID=UPI00206A0806|nr:hypothetical protein [uncultured Megasphaera sp.]DAL49082.1 MAG TPA_asm: hypothetical protein [Caudoviricetes sp.]
MTPEEVMSLRPDELKNFLTAKLIGMDEMDVISLWNEYCRDTDHPLSIIYENDEETINSLFNSPMEAVRAIAYGKYKYYDGYFYRDAYNSMISFENLVSDKSPYMAERLIKWLVRYDRYLDFDLERSDQ